jgi:uncharacterized protein YndB with AHSA1/START domain
MGSYAVEVHCRASRVVVWDVLADAAGWSQWAGPLVAESNWERAGDEPPGGVGAVRTIGRRPVHVREEVLEWAPPSHLAYTVLTRFGLRGYHGDVDLREGASGTTIHWRGDFEATIPGTADLLSWCLSKAVRDLARRAAAEADRRHLRAAT